MLRSVLYVAVVAIPLFCFGYLTLLESSPPQSTA